MLRERRVGSSFRRKSVRQLDGRDRLSRIHPAGKRPGQPLPPIGQGSSFEGQFVERAVFDVDDAEYQVGDLKPGANILSPASIA